MQITIIYATTEGQTRKIARHVQRHLANAGHSVELLPAEAALGDDSGQAVQSDATILMGSVHVGKYQPALLTFAAREAASLAARPNMFISVSLAAAGDDPEDWEGLATCISRFAEHTGWNPDRVEHVAGAFKFSDYNWFKTWAMLYIQSKKDPTAQAKGDVEYTDWGALDTVLDDWVASI